ncbi:unnamed protein product, partial [marine sediment metagenome]
MFPITRFVSSKFVPTGILAIIERMGISCLGINSNPKLGTIYTLPATSSRVAAITVFRCRRAQPRDLRYTFLIGSNRLLPGPGPDSSRLLPFKRVEAIMGTMVRETNKEASSARHTVKAKGRESLPAIPDVNTMGKNTAIVVS